MIKFPRLDRLRLGALSLIAIAALLVLWGPREAASATAIEQASPPAQFVTTLTAEKVASLFAIETLPEPPPVVEAPPDPAAELKRHRLIGVIASDGMAIALLTDGAAQLRLKEGDALAGFELVALEARRAEFKKGELLVALDLPME